MNLPRPGSADPSTPDALGFPISWVFSGSPSLDLGPTLAAPCACAPQIHDPEVCSLPPGPSLSAKPDLLRCNSVQRQPREATLMPDRLFLSWDVGLRRPLKHTQRSAGPGSPRPGPALSKPSSTQETRLCPTRFHVEQTLVLHSSQGKAAMPEVHRNHLSGQESHCSPPLQTALKSCFPRASSRCSLILVQDPHVFVCEEVQKGNVANCLVNVTHCDFFGNPAVRRRLVPDGQCLSQDIAHQLLRGL